MKVIFAVAMIIFCSGACATTVTFEDGTTYELRSGEQIWVLTDARQLAGDSDPLTQTPGMPLAPNGMTELELYDYCGDVPAVGPDSTLADFRNFQEFNRVCNANTKLPICSAVNNIAELCSPAP